MRVCFDLLACQTASSRLRGVGNYSLGLVNGVAGLAPTTSVFLVGRRDPASVREIAAACAGRMPAHHLKTVELALGNHFDCPHEVPLSAMQAATLARAYARLDPDILHLSSLFESDIHFPPPVRCAGLVKSVTLYDLIPRVFPERYLANPRVAQWYADRLAALKQFDLLLAISEASRQDAINRLGIAPRKVVTILGACDPGFTPRQLPPDEACQLWARYGITRPFLMFTGGVDWRKNLDGAIRAYARLPATTREGHCFAIVCKMSEAEKSRLLAIAAQAGLAPGEIILTGFVAQTDLVALYRACRAFVFPSIYEGFGLPPLEAISCGAPVIVANNSSLPEIVTRRDAWFDAQSETEIAEKMNAVLTQEDFRRSLVESGLARAAEFTWERSARLAHDAWQEALVAARAESAAIPTCAAGRRLRLAYVTPLPPERSGIADFSAELLRELGVLCDIELFTTAHKVEDPWLRANHPIHPVAELDALAPGFDLILYAFGNSSFHTHMFDLLRRWPGVVDLHDIYLSGAFAQVGLAAFGDALLRSHGPEAGALRPDNDSVRQAIMRFPANREVFDHALGVIVHSPFGAELARSFYPGGIPAPLQVIPLLRRTADGVRAPARVAAARHRLGVAQDEFVVCTFGHVAGTKCPQELIGAFALFATAHPARKARLVFVGDANKTEFEAIRRELTAGTPIANAILVTGFVSAETYDDWLAVGHVAVQLRRNSRGETSRAVLDCMAAGIPVILNRYAGYNDYPADTAQFVPAIADATAVANALGRLATDPTQSQSQARAAMLYVETRHHPGRIAQAYCAALRNFLARGWGRDPRRLIGAVEAMRPNRADLHHWLNALAASDVELRPARIYLVVTPRKTPPPPWEGLAYAALREAGAETWPVCLNSAHTALLACHPPAKTTAKFLATDTAIHVQHGDVLLLSHHVPPPKRQLLERLRHAGVAVHLLVVDGAPGLPAPATLLADLAHIDALHLPSSNYAAQVLAATKNTPARPLPVAHPIRFACPADPAHAEDGPDKIWAGHAQSILQALQGHWAGTLASDAPAGLQASPATTRK